MPALRSVLQMAKACSGVEKQPVNSVSFTIYGAGPGPLLRNREFLVPGVLSKFSEDK